MAQVPQGGDPSADDGQQNRTNTGLLPLPSIDDLDLDDAMLPDPSSLMSGSTSNFVL